MPPRTVTPSLAVPSEVNTSSQIQGEVGKVETAISLPGRLLVRAEPRFQEPHRARRHLCPRPWNEIELSTRLPGGMLRASVKTGEASSKERRPAFGLSGLPTSGKVSKETQSHMRKVENKRPGCPGRSSSDEMTPRPSIDTRVSDIEGGFTEERKHRRPRLPGQQKNSRGSPAVAGETPPIPLSSSLPSSLLVR